MKRALFILFFIVWTNTAHAHTLYKRGSSAKAWVNGKEIDLSNGGSYSDKNGNYVAVSNNGNGISMVSASSGGGNGNGISMVSASSGGGDGGALNNHAQKMLANSQQQMRSMMQNMFSSGFPFSN